MGYVRLQDDGHSPQSQDRPDLSVPSRLLAQHMANPTEGTVVSLKRVLRYIRKHPVGRSLMRWCCGSELTVMTDSDWARDAQHRKSMSGGILLHGSAMISHWSKTQSNVALSSGEAELNGAVKGISELLESSG